MPCNTFCSRLVPSIGEKCLDFAVSRHIDSDCTSDRTRPLRGSVSLLFEFYLPIMNTERKLILNYDYRVLR